MQTTLQCSLKDTIKLWKYTQYAYFSVSEKRKILWGGRLHKHKLIIFKLMLGVMCNILVIFK